VLANRSGTFSQLLDKLVCLKLCFLDSVLPIGCYLSRLRLVILDYVIIDIVIWLL